MSSNYEVIKVYLRRFISRYWLLTLLCLAGPGFFLTTRWLNQGESRTFISSEEFGTEARYPNFRIEHPANWYRMTYKGQSKSYDDVWVMFSNRPLGLFQSQWLWVYWQPVDKPTFADIAAWSHALIEQSEGYDVSTLQGVVVGAKNHEAWMNTYQNGRGLIKLTAIYIPSDHGIFALEYPTEDLSEEILAHMLDSFCVMESGNGGAAAAPFTPPHANINENSNAVACIPTR